MFCVAEHSPQEEEAEVLPRACTALSSKQSRSVARKVLRRAAPQDIAYMLRAQEVSSVWVTHIGQW